MPPLFRNLLIRSHYEVELNCQIKYLKYVVIALILRWRSIHLAEINLQLLNLAIWFNIWKGLSVAHAVFRRIFNHICAFHVSHVQDLISNLNWCDLESLKLQHDGCLSNGEMIRQILVKLRKHIGKEFYQRHQERAISYNSNCKKKL